MKIIKNLAMALCVLTSSQALAFNKWHINNRTNDSLYLACKNTTVTAFPISMQSQIAPGTTYVFDWGGMYNDGLGVNPGRWNCTINGQSMPSFETNWGMYDHALTITKVDDAYTWQ